MKLDGSKLPLPGSLGSKRLATRKQLGKVTVLSAKVHTGTTLLWVYATGSEQATTSERLEKAVQLLYDRTQQAKSGAGPITKAEIK
jgi:hypothetical protein